MIVMGQQKHMENSLGISRRIYKRDIPGCGHMCVCICICIYEISRYKYTHNTQHTTRTCNSVSFACSNLCLCVLPSCTLHIHHT